MSKRVHLQIVGLLALGIVAGIPTRSLAQEDNIYSRNGAYAHFGVVLGFATFSNLGSNEVLDPLSMGVNARLGYRFHPHIAIEGQFEWIDGWDLVDLDTLNSLRVERIVTGSANIKGFILTNQIQPYGVLGMGATHIREVDEATGSHRISKTEFSVRVGAGADWYLTDALGLNLEASFVTPIGDMVDYHYTSLAIGFFLRF
jgi:opacity protein-like surface antigen